MKMSNKDTRFSSCVVILIPIYKEYNSLNESEIRLLNKIKTVFSNREIRLILPKSLKKEWNNNNEFQSVSFNDNFFTDKFSYSKLLCRKFFYDTFSNFQYLQIIQTDCWVFEDKLDFFTNLNFDYIGAPWMVDAFVGKPKEQLWRVGNGGFSLRKVKTFKSIIEQIESTPKGRIPVFKFKQNTWKGIIKRFGFRNNLKHYIKEAPGEDIFWSTYIPEIFSADQFKIADPQTAASYSFEVLPEFLFREVTKGILPMGCHNWMNNNPDFWKNYIRY